MSETQNTLFDRAPSVAEAAVTTLRSRLLGEHGLAHLSNQCTSLTLKTDSVGIRVTQEAVVINDNGDPDSTGGTAFSFSQDGHLLACEAMSSTRICDDAEVGHFIAIVSAPDLNGSLSVELTFPADQ